MSMERKRIALARIGLGFSVGVILAIIARPLLGLRFPEWLPLALLAVPLIILPIVHRYRRREREEIARRAARDLVDRIQRERGWSDRP